LRDEVIEIRLAIKIGSAAPAGRPKQAAKLQRSNRRR
jgi:hypothetical protein